MTLNGVIAVYLRYFTKFGKPAFQHLTASARIQLMHQKSVSVTQKCKKTAVYTNVNGDSELYIEISKNKKT